MADLIVLEKGLTPNALKTTQPDGSPLGVCINDCEIDYGQPYEDLVNICVSLRCAFAEMRWGKRQEDAVQHADFKKVRSAAS